MQIRTMVYLIIACMVSVIVLNSDHASARTSLSELENQIQNEGTERAAADANLQQQIDDIELIPGPPGDSVTGPPGPQGPPGDADPSEVVAQAPYYPVTMVFKGNQYFDVHALSAVGVFFQGISNPPHDIPPITLRNITPTSQFSPFVGDGGIQGDHRDLHDWAEETIEAGRPNPYQYLDFTLKIFYSPTIINDQETELGSHFSIDLLDCVATSITKGYEANVIREIVLRPGGIRFTEPEAGFVQGHRKLGLPCLDPSYPGDVTVGITGGRSNSIGVGSITGGAYMNRGGGRPDYTPLQLHNICGTSDQINVLMDSISHVVGNMGTESLRIRIDYEDGEHFGSAWFRGIYAKELWFFNPLSSAGGRMLPSATFTPGAVTHDFR